MGADLYIRELPGERQVTGFKTSLKAGYFRDSYNHWNVLWQYGLDYWNTIAKEYSTDYVMSPQQARALLTELKKREPVFQGNMLLMLHKRNPVWDYSDGWDDKKKEWGKPVWKPEKMTLAERKDAVKWYVKHAKELRSFLTKAIKLKSPIECSI